VTIKAFENMPIVDIGAGCRHSMFLAKKNSVYGCGDAKSGQLGIGVIINGSNEQLFIPTRIEKLQN
jgi:alpha-tubulin suppressor-like RCC1 family protein